MGEAGRWTERSEWTARRRWTEHPLVQLTLVRYREFFREPEAVFWVFVFPVLLSAGLGLAFQEPPQHTPFPVSEQRGSRYIDFVVPGLLGMNLMGSGMWGLGFAIVDARRKRLLKRLIATPMSRGQYLASFVLSRLTLLVLEVSLLLGFAALVFDVPLYGPAPALVLICLLSSLAFGSLGLLTASRAQTLEGVSGLMNLVMLPMWIFSGVFFSSSRFPEAAQPFIQALPLTAVVDALRANMLQGAGWQALAPELGIIAGWMTLSFVLALRLFRWK